MMNKKQFLESQKDCASMMGMSLKQYQEEVTNIKIPKIRSAKKRYDNTILDKLGLKPTDLKKKKVI